MKKLFSLAVFLSLHTIVPAQLYVQSGATLHIGGTVTLHNEDFIRGSGGGPVITFEPGSNVLFTGDQDNIISGYIGLLNIEIAKEGTHKVSLQDYNEEVRGQMKFTSGFFDVNNNTLLLGSTGMLVNENESSCIIGAVGGTVQASMELNQPDHIDPGNIGATVTSSQNLGNVMISRGYVYPAGLPLKAVQRYYSFSFVNTELDNGLDATLRLSYFDAELSGADETKLLPWKYDNAGYVWLEQGPSANITRDIDENWVQLTGINSLSPWTLAESSGTVPVSFALFNVSCYDNAAVINWQTATESNTQHFDVQRSSNGTDWITIATQQAAGNSNSLLAYSYTDRNNTTSGALYRIRSVDMDGHKTYTAIEASSCGASLWQVWPNPVQQQAYMNLNVDGAYTVSLQLLDSKGSIVRSLQKSLVRGDNRFSVDMHDLPGGVYHLVATWNDGRSRRSAQILKQ